MFLLFVECWVQSNAAFVPGIVVRLGYKTFTHEPGYKANKLQTNRSPFHKLEDV